MEAHRFCPGYKSWSPASTIPICLHTEETRGALQFGQTPSLRDCLKTRAKTQTQQVPNSRMDQEMLEQNACEGVSSMADCSSHCTLHHRNAGGDRPQHTIEQFVNTFQISLAKTKRKTFALCKYCTTPVQ